MLGLLLCELQELLGAGEGGGKPALRLNECRAIVLDEVDVLLGE